MKIEPFFEQFELLTDAPNGVQKLRELILQLAVQGKLVPQNPDDEPASVLLERIEEEKKRLVQEGKIKKSTNILPIKTNEVPFELPRGWEWVRLEKLCEVITKGSSPKWQGVNYVDKGNEILFITSENVRNYSLNLEEPKYVEDKFNEIEPRSILRRNDILMNIVGASIGRTAIYEYDEIANINQAVCLIRIVGQNRLVNLKYLLSYFNSALCISLMFDKQVDNARANLSMGNISKFVIPLAPYQEQSRITQKVDRLMALCDELEARQQKRHDRILQLGEVATSQLLTLSTPEAFNQHWQSICDNFDLLYSTPENVSQLRQAILQLAVMGKLVPQNPDDEPASVLLERIRQEKARLVKDKRIQGSKNLPPLKQIEIPYQLPNNWIWTKIGQICGSIVPNRDKPKSFSGGFPWITLPDFEENKIELNKKESGLGLSESEVREFNARVIPCGSAIMSCVGRFGLAAVVTEDVVTNQQIHGFVIPAGLNSRYVAYLIKAQRAFLESTATSTTIYYLNKTKCESIPFPLPPTSEQHRIVAKVDRLMALCDELEAKLTQSISNREKLMETAVSQVLAA
ncbi:MAG: restriction endonuclease subunit S [Coleofasciculaceae cyanobacterium]